MTKEEKKQLSRDIALQCNADAIKSKSQCNFSNRLGMSYSTTKMFNNSSKKKSNGNEKIKRTLIYGKLYEDFTILTNLRVVH